MLDPRQRFSVPVQQIGEAEKILDYPVQRPSPFGETMASFVCTRLAETMPLLDNVKYRRQISVAVSANVIRQTAFGKKGEPIALTFNDANQRGAVAQIRSRAHPVGSEKKYVPIGVHICCRTQCASVHPPSTGDHTLQELRIKVTAPVVDQDERAALQQRTGNGFVDTPDTLEPLRNPSGFLAVNGTDQFGQLRLPGLRFVGFKKKIGTCPLMKRQV